MSAPRASLTVLFILSFINLFNYLDRYILVALSPAIKRDLALSDAQVGFLTTAFMWIYILVSPLMGWLGDRWHRYRLISAGVAVWSAATALTGQARAYSGLIWSRFFVGTGEAAYGSISPALLTDLYPPAVRGRVFAVFFMAIPVGSALGYLLGGVLEGLVGWRQAFLVAGLPGVALAVVLLFLREPERGAQHEAGEKVALPLMPTLRALRKNTNFVYTVLGYTAYTFVLGAIAVWIPHYIERYMGMPAAEGNMFFGAITVVAGILGTFVGGFWGDRWAKRSADAYLKLGGVTALLAVPVLWLALSTSNFPVFVVLVFALEFLLFLSTSPINAQTVNSVAPAMRAMASAVTIFSIHFLGDAISAPLVGVISDRVDLRAGMLMLVPALLVCGLFWLYKAVFLWDAMPWPAHFHLPRAQGHRGMHIEGVPENTLAAFCEAAKRGAKMVELDVRLDRDRVPVVVHDLNLERISGHKTVVAESTAADLDRLGGVPTLEAVLRSPECGGLKINVELKCETAKDTGLERAVAEVIHRVPGAHDRVLFSSFNPLVLRRLSNLLPQVPRALLVTCEDDPANKIYLKRMWLAFLARPHMLNLDQAMITPAYAAKLAKRNVPFAVWTIADPAHARALLSLGAKSIISPDPNIV